MDSDNRRRFDRIDPGAITLCMTRGEAEECIIGTPRNIAQGGIMLEMQSMLENCSCNPGDTFTISECPPPWDSLLKGRLCTVVWRRSDIVGIEFDDPLEYTTAELRSWLREYLLD